jgi:hypothetical protein
MRERLNGGGTSVNRIVFVLKTSPDAPVQASSPVFGVKVSLSSGTKIERLL